MSVAQKSQFDPSAAIFDLLYDNLKYDSESIVIGSRGDNTWQPLIAIVELNSGYPLAYIRSDPSDSKSALNEEAQKYKQFCKRTHINVPLYLFVPSENKIQIHVLNSTFKWKAISESTFPTYQNLLSLAEENRKQALTTSSNTFLRLLFRFIEVVGGGLLIAGLAKYLGWV